MTKSVLDFCKSVTLVGMVCFAAACSSDDSKTGIDGGNQLPDISAVSLNEINGFKDYIELYNSSDTKVSLRGAKIRRFRVNDGVEDKQTLWVGTDEVIGPKSYLCLAYEAGKENVSGFLKRDFSARKNTYIFLLDAAGLEKSVFVRGQKGVGWNQVHMQKCESPEGVAYSFSKVGGEWVYAVSTPGTANGAKVGDIDQKMLPIVINEIDFENNKVELFNNSSEKFNIVGFELRWSRIKDMNEDNKTVWTTLVETNIDPYGYYVADLSEIDLKDYVQKNFRLCLRDGSTSDGHVDFTKAKYVYDEVKRGSKSTGWTTVTLSSAIAGRIVRVPDGTGEWLMVSTGSMGHTNGTPSGKTISDIDGY